MKFTYLLPGFSFFDGCIYNRNFLPGLSLKELGHDVDITLLQGNISKDKLLTMDFVIMSRYYIGDISNLVMFLKRNGIKIVYETDDDLECIPDTNPTKSIIEPHLESVYVLGHEADLITTTTPYIATQLEKRYKKTPAVLPNALSFKDFKIREKGNLTPRIGWTGGVTHCVDLIPTVEAMVKLQDKYKFEFFLQGITAYPWEAQVFEWHKSCELGFNDPNSPFMKSALELSEKLKGIKNFTPIPFYPTGMFPTILNRMNLDIGICPLFDSPFSRAKSAMKYYEYASSETATLASNVIPYTTEITQPESLTDNLVEDWYAKLEGLLKDRQLRAKIAKEQYTWVRKNRDIEVIALEWERAFKKMMEEK